MTVFTCCFDGVHPISVCLGGVHPGSDSPAGTDPYAPGGLCHLWGLELLVAATKIISFYFLLIIFVQFSKIIFSRLTYFAVTKELAQETDLTWKRTCITISFRNFCQTKPYHVLLCLPNLKPLLSDVAVVAPPNIVVCLYIFEIKVIDGFVEFVIAYLYI